MGGRCFSLFPPLQASLQCGTQLPPLWVPIQSPCFSYSRGSSIKTSQDVILGNLFFDLAHIFRNTIRNRRLIAVTKVWTCSNSCPLSWRCHPTVSSSVIAFSHLQSSPASGSFLMSQFFAHQVVKDTPPRMHSGEVSGVTPICLPWR